MMTQEELNRSVLIISENGKSFIMNSISTALKPHGIESQSIAASLAEVSTVKDIPPLILISGGDFWEEHYDTLVYLKDISKEKATKFALIGTPDENDKLKRIFPSSLIAGEFIRPIEVGDVALKIDGLLTELAKSRDKKTILVVDDSGMMLRTIMSWLNGKYTVNLANSATSAFTSIHQCRPDLILLDYEMPVCSGAQLLEMLRSEEDTKDIPVIFLTSKGDVETVKTVAALRPEGYLLKTTPSAQVVAAIDDFFLKRAANII